MEFGRGKGEGDDAVNTQRCSFQFGEFDTQNKRVWRLFFTHTWSS